MNLTNLDYLKLMADGDQDMEQTMLEMLLVELPEEFDKMKTLFAASAWLPLSKVSHKMKSTLPFIGNDELTSANLRIEQLTKQEDHPPLKDEIIIIEDSIQQFGNLLPGVIEELNKILNTY
jgi:HPt (histidine-containing phosphotransfer) domain-containing protein